MSEEVNRKLPGRNTMVQLLTFHTDPKRHNTIHSVTDRQMDKQHYDAKSWSYCMKLMTP